MDNRQVKLTKNGTPLTEFQSRLSKEDAGKQAQRWLVLRNKTRLRIIDLLNRYDGLLCVTEVANVLEEVPSVISGHLAIFKAAGLVECEKRQVYAYYRIKANAFDGCWDYLEGFVGS
jgi:ArsR family transcriptional regulator, arsenate/arsenite/antimonite-responsive transcriptional repressor